MIPKKSSLLYKELSEEMDLPQDLIQDFIEFYYKEIRSNLTGLKHPRVNVDGLGQFVVRTHAVRKAIPRLKKILETHDTTTFSAYFNKKMLEDKVEALENVEKQIVSLEEKKEAIQKQKDEYIKKNLEGQKKNS
jgi:nucleoid DNA-binding protein